MSCFWRAPFFIRGLSVADRTFLEREILLSRIGTNRSFHSKLYKCVSFKEVVYDDTQDADGKSANRKSHQKKVVVSQLRSYEFVHRCSHNHSSSLLFIWSRSSIDPSVIQHIIMKSLIRDSSLTSLSAVWVTLCTGLVWKHPELLLVFVSFTTCFGIAFVLGRPQNKVRVQIGIMACVVALLSLYHFRVPPPEYLALSILVGFLAFDHWYSAMYCTKPLAVAVEDALTLTLQLTLLVLVLSSDQQAWWSSYRSFLLTWIVYKITRLTGQVDQVPSSGETKKLGIPAATNGSSKEFTKTQITSTTEKPFSNTDMLWTIRGEQYDLNDYISHHPGGKEAILLGRGRDCTALFESYHPFTQQHETVLQKYRIHKTDTDISSKDAFYNILCQRVQESLKEQNFHPRNDRAASWLRCFYYAIIVTGVLLSARAHFKVRRDMPGSVERFNRKSPPHSFLSGQYLGKFLFGSVRMVGGSFGTRRWSLFRESKGVDQ